jgi:hypothetical protein
MATVNSRLHLQIPIESCDGFVSIDVPGYAELPPDDREFVASIVQSMLDHALRPKKEMPVDEQAK